jgi:hypothetical protein
MQISKISTFFMRLPHQHALIRNQCMMFCARLVPRLHQLISSPDSAGAMISGNQTPLEQPHFAALSFGATPAEIACSRAVPPDFKHHTGANCSAENPSPERNPGPKRTQTDAIFKNENEIKIKNKLDPKIFWASNLSNATINRLS